MPHNTVGNAGRGASRVVAIDGPAASGKSTVARLVAERLGFTFLDTGAMYRAVTLICIERDADLTDARACEAIAYDVELSFDDQGRVLIDGVSREEDIRGERVTALVSMVSAHPGVRRAMVEQQRTAASSERVLGIVAEGRDMTSVVFPETPHKFFLIASSNERARRRAHQLGRPEDVARIESELSIRDHLDSTRADSPLVKTDGVHEIDTDALKVEDVAQAILDTVAKEGERPSHDGTC